MCWFIFINWNSFLCVSVSPKVISSKFLVAETARNSKKYLTSKFPVAETPVSATEKNCVAETPFPANEFFCFSELKTEYFSASKIKYYFD